MVKIYTDGACSGNPGPGGWGALIIFDDDSRMEISGGMSHTTNNQMELTAAIEALKFLKDRDDDREVILYTDSTYVLKGITEWIYKWEKNDWCKRDNTSVKNTALWKNLQHELKKHNNVSWQWVKGHSNNEGNTIADRLAVKARENTVRSSASDHPRPIIRRLNHSSDRMCSELDLDDPRSS